MVELADNVDAVARVPHHHQPDQQWILGRHYVHIRIGLAASMELAGQLHAERVRDLDRERVIIPITTITSISSLSLVVDIDIDID